MKHILLKFNHGVEIGAYKAYIGHWYRTRDLEIARIANDEIEHREDVRQMLDKLDELPSPAIDGFFNVVGDAIQFSCKFCPLWSLDLVARVMEAFAIFNYRRLAKLYPQFSDKLNYMAGTEDKHAVYFRRIS